MDKILGVDEFLEWMYHPAHGARLFTSQDELKDAGPGWVDTPTKFGQPEPELVVSEDASPVDLISALPKLDARTFTIPAITDPPFDPDSNTVALGKAGYATSVEVEPEPKKKKWF